MNEHEAKTGHQVYVILEINDGEAKLECEACGEVVSD